MQERRPSVITSSYHHKIKEPRSLSPTVQMIELGSSKIETVSDLSTDGATIETVEDMGCLVDTLVDTLEEFTSR